MFLVIFYQYDAGSSSQHNMIVGS